VRTPFASLFDRRGSLENPSVSLANALTAEWERLTTAGVALSEEMAAGVPDVFACIQVLSQDVGRCPLKLRRRGDDGRHEDAVDHPMWELLYDLPNPEMTAYQFRAEMQRHLLTYRRAYAEIVRNGRGEIVSLWVLDPRHMTVERDALNRKVWIYRAPNVREMRWTFHPSTPPILELTHDSPVTKCRDLVGLAYALDQFGAKFFANGARPSGTLEIAPGQTANDEQRKNMREQFQSMFSGSENAGKVAVLSGGVTFKPMTIANNEAQYNETRKYIRTQIAGVFRVPPHKIGDLERATFSNIEHQSIDYVTGTLDPFLVAWEQAIRRDLLTSRQFPRYAAVFDRAALIKADIKAQFDAFAVARQNGWMSANDVLRKLDENAIPTEKGGDVYLVNGNMVPVQAAGTQQQQQQPQQPDAPASEGAAA
jgi:HK97 family phage portal protein